MGVSALPALSRSNSTKRGTKITLRSKRSNTLACDVAWPFRSLAYSHEP